MKKLLTRLQSGIRLGGFQSFDYKLKNEERYDGLPEPSLNEGVYLFQMNLSKPFESYVYPHDFYFMEVSEGGCSEIIPNKDLIIKGLEKIPINPGCKVASPLF